ncbi:hypothetical protein ACFL4E_03235, partial [Candidatus Omnitrophota bacterium]
QFTGDVYVGRYFDPFFYWEGEIADVRTYDRVLINSEAADLYSGTDVTSGLVASWTMNEGAGTMVNDNIGSNNGIIDGGATWVGGVDSIENHPSGLLKRKTEAATGDIYEYVDEDYNAQGQGRVTLIYDSSLDEYRTYDWGDTQVTVNVYTGEYSPNPEDPLRSDVITSERIETYTYNHNGQGLDDSNEWILTQKTTYQADGVTLDVDYTYYADADNYMESKTLSSPDASGNIYYHYMNENWADQGFGRMDESHLASPNSSGDEEFEYTYRSGTDRVKYIDSYRYDSGVRVDEARYEYYDSPSAFLKRKEETTMHIIYEYMDEDWNGMGYGRTILSTTGIMGGQYYTYDRGDTQVTVDEYWGAYNPADDGDVLSDVTDAERWHKYIYDHNGEVVNIDTSTNNWVMRKEIEYGLDGITEIAGSEYDEYERQINWYNLQDNWKENFEYFDINGAYSDKYSYREYLVYDTQELETAYRYFENSTNRIYQKIDAVNNKKYQYHDLDGWKMEVKWDSDGHTYGYDIDGTTLQWEQYDDNSDGSIDTMKTFESGYDNFYSWDQGEDLWEYTQSWDQSAGEWVTRTPSDVHPDDIPDEPVAGLSQPGATVSSAMAVIEAATDTGVKEGTVADPEEKDEEIKGVEVQEVLLKHKVIKKSQEDFTGYSPKEDVPEQNVTVN